MNITVFCSQYEIAENYKKAAQTLARLIGERDHTLVWGGTDTGLMGVIARSAQENGARVVGIIREKIRDRAYKNADEMIVVKDSKEMNLGLIERGDVIVVFPGGIGTLNELTEVLRMKKNGLLDKPTVVVNTDGFYDSFREQLLKMHDEGFLNREVIDSVHFAPTPEEAIRFAEEAEKK
ncbi:MAG: TIGR00730 family Rossman fold protein [Parcubacteria group bacterium]|nr:TIGR00730 family Rossman fold protein [Parcubacteria group bacterium]